MSDGTTITSNSRRFSSIAAFTSAGLLSGILTALSLFFLKALNSFVGATFGAVIVICLSIRQRMWSMGRTISFIASSVIAYFAATWSPVGALYVFRALVKIQDQKVPNIFGPLMFSIAGFVGAFVFMLAVLVLFFQEKGWRVPARALLLAMPGIPLGWLSAIASESVENIVSHWITPSSSWGGGPEQFYSAYLIWQTGISFVIAAFAPQTSDLPLSKQTASMQISLMKVSIGGKIFVACMLAGTAVLGFFEARNYYRATYPQRQIEKSRKQAPPGENLPEVKLRPIDQALIFSKIAGYAESGAELSQIPARREYRGNDSGYSSSAAVPRVLYNIRYQKSGITDDRTPSVTARVWDYPNADWAKYELRNTPFRDAAILVSGQIKIVTKFGSSVLINMSGGLFSSYVYWPSTNKIVVLHYSGPEDDEFVRQYLARYPSSL